MRGWKGFRWSASFGNKANEGSINLRPPKPRYSSTWDVDRVVCYISSMGQNTDLSRKQLNQKLALLMVLVVASQTSDLRFHMSKPDGVMFD